MAWKQLGGGSGEYDYMQGSAPGSPSLGETWLDTSSNPPVAKVYADFGGGGQWTQIQASQKIQNNLDAPVSSAGATQSEIETAVDNSATASTVSSNLDAPVSSAGGGLGFLGKFQVSLATFLLQRRSLVDAEPQGIAFNPDGTSMFIIGNATDEVFQYSLSSPFVVSSARYEGARFAVSQQTLAPTDIAFKPDGTRMFVTSNGPDEVFQYSLGSAFDLSTASYNGTSKDVQFVAESPQGLTFKPDGTSMFIVSAGSDDQVFEYSLGSAFDLSTASYTNKGFKVASETNLPQSVAFKPDGTLMFVLGDSPVGVFQYSLGSAFDLSTASFGNQSLDVSGKDDIPKGLTFKPDGSSMFFTGERNAAVYQYLVGKAAPK